MEIEKTTALILRSVDFAETSKVLTLFTRDLGKLGVMAKGGRRPKSSFEVALDLLSVCSICVIHKPSAELDLLTEAVLLERFEGLRHDLPALYAAYYVVEVLEGLTEIGDPHPSLFEKTLVVLRKLADGDERVLTLAWYQLLLLKDLGYAPNLENCTACCGACQLAARMVYSVPTGGILCEQCASRIRKHQTIEGGTAQVMKSLLRAEDGPIERLVIDSRTREQLWRITSDSIQYQLGRVPRMMEMLE